MPSTPIKISMRGLAEVAAAAAKRKPAAIRKYRFPASEESIGKSNYYVKALSAIKRHHKGDHVYVNNLLQELLAAITTETDSRKRAKYTNNYRAITDYLKSSADGICTFNLANSFITFTKMSLSARGLIL